MWVNSTLVKCCQQVERGLEPVSSGIIQKCSDAPQVRLQRISNPQSNENHRVIAVRCEANCLLPVDLSASRTPWLRWTFISFLAPGDEGSCIKYRHVGKFSTRFYVFTASRAWLKFVYLSVRFQVFRITYTSSKQGRVINVQIVFFFFPIHCT